MIFVPSANFLEIADTLDAETLQGNVNSIAAVLDEIHQVADRESLSLAYYNIMLFRSWRGSEVQLAQLGLVCVEKLRSFGIKNYDQARMEWHFVNATSAINDGAMDMPWWIDDERVHMSHRSVLLQIDSEYYQPLYGDVPVTPIFWPER